MSVSAAQSILAALNQGEWTRPSDKMAVYTEIEAGNRWGIRVTLYGNSASIEAVNGEESGWYKAPEEFYSEVGPPTFLERLRGITFEDKLFREVERKRAVARMQNANERAGSGNAARKAEGIE